MHNLILWIPGLMLGFAMSDNSRFKKFLTPTRMMLFMLFVSLLFVTACNTFGAISAMLPALATLAENLVAFIVGLKGGQVSPVLLANIQKWQADVATEITNVQAIIAAASANPMATTLQKMQAIFSAIASNLGSILSGANIVDGATVSKFTALAGLFIACVQTVLGIIQSLQPTAAAYDAKKISEHDAETAVKHVSSLLDHNHKLMKETFADIVSTPSGSPEVDAVLKTLTPLP